MKPSHLFLCGLLCAPFALTAQAAESLTPHVHGTAHLNLLLEGEELVVEFHSAAHNLLGFEHPAATAEEKAQLARLETAMGDPAHLLELPAAAHCRLELSRVAQPQFVTEHAGEQDADHDHEHEADEHEHEHEYEHEDHVHATAEHEDHDHAQGKGHLNLDFEYHFACSQPAQLQRIRLAIFDHYPALEKIELQALIPQPLVQTLTPEEADFELK